MTELSGIALSFQLVTDISYLFWIPLVGLMAGVALWALPFEILERIYGILGLSMLVFVVAVWQLHPDWAHVWHSATTVAPTSGETWPIYAFFAITLVGAQMTPYEMFFFCSGGIEHRWGPRSLREMRINVTIVAVFSAMLLPLALFPVLLVGNDDTQMGERRNGKLSNAIGTVTLAGSCVVSVAAPILLIYTRGGSG